MNFSCSIGHYSVTWILLLMASVGVAQTDVRMEPVTPSSFSIPPDDAVTDNIVVSFRFGPRKGSSTTSYIPGSDNFTWYCRLDRTTRIHLNDSIVRAGVSIQVNNTSERQLVELNGVLYSLAGTKVSRDKISRKFFAKSSTLDVATYTLPLNAAFRNAIVEVNYSVEFPYETSAVFWKANELYGKGRARYVLQAPEFLEMSLEYVNLRDSDLAVLSDNMNGYLSYEVLQSNSGRALDNSLVKVNASYQINRTIVVLPTYAAAAPRAIVAKLVRTKPVPTR